MAQTTNPHQVEPNSNSKSNFEKNSQSLNLTTALAQLCKSNKPSPQQELLFAKIQERESELTDHDRLIAWALGILETGPSSISLKDVQKYARVTILKSLLVRDGLKLGLVSELLFGLANIPELANKLRTQIDRPDLDIFLVESVRSGDEKRALDLVKSLDVLKKVPLIYSSVVIAIIEKLENKRPLFESLINGIDHAGSSRPDKFIATTDLLDLVGKAIESDKTINLKAHRLTTAVKCLTVDVLPSDLRASTFWNRLSIADWAALLQDKEISKGILRGDSNGAFFYPILDSLLSENLQRESFADVLKLRSDYLKDRGDELIMISRNVASRDGFVRAIVRDHTLEDKVSELTAEVESLKETLNTVNSENRSLSQRVARLTESLDEFENARGQMVREKAADAQSFNQVVEAAVARAWAASLLPILRELQGLGEERLTEALSRVRIELRNRGLEMIEQLGDVVVFDPRHHELLGQSQTGRGKVVEPGFMWISNGAEVLLAKSVLMPA